MKDPSNGDVVDVTRKDNARERVIKLNGNVILDGHAYLIPWVKQDFKIQLLIQKNYITGIWKVVQRLGHFQMNIKCHYCLCIQIDRSR